MKKELIFLVLLLNSIIFINASTTISTCQTINSSYSFDTDRTILLDTDILNDDGSCMTIEESNLIFDCQNNLIQGDNDTSGNAILIIGANTNITIQNCIIEDFNKGIVKAGIQTSNLYYILNNSLNNMKNNFIELRTTGPVHLIDNLIANGVYGVILNAVDNSYISNNFFSNLTNRCLIGYSGFDNNNINNNIFNNCGEAIIINTYHRTANYYQNTFINNTIDLNFNSEYAHSNIFYNNTLNSSKIVGNYINLSFFNTSTTGNIWLDFNGSNPFCFGTPSGVCDNFPSAYTVPTPQQPTQTSLTSLPSISTYSIILIFISIILFL